MLPIYLEKPTSKVIHRGASGDAGKSSGSHLSMASGSPMMPKMELAKLAPE